MTRGYRTDPTPEGPRLIPITAKYRARCWHCDGPIERGETCAWAPTARLVFHPDCVEAARTLKGGALR
jgi:hypothetical protein